MLAIVLAPSFEVLGDECVLGTEPLVERFLGDTGLMGELLDPDSVNTVVAEQLSRHFEHSLGVMHMATMLYEGIAERSRDVLQSQLGYNEDGIKRHRTLVRLAALLHDVGHSPFSHAAEELFPVQGAGSTERFKHEQYSAAIVRRYFADVIKNQVINGGGATDFCARFLDQEDAPITSLKVSLPE